MEPTFDIHVNGQPHRIPPGLSVATLLAYLEIRPDRVAVELNKTLIRKRDWHQTPVESQARLEIVEFVGGG
jgi:thiamine biosynthesis protein ThiS